MQYKYLKKSQKIGKEFDLRFDKIKNSMVTGGLSAAFTFLKYRVQHGSEKIREPSTKEDLIRLEEELPILKP